MIQRRQLSIRKNRRSTVLEYASRPTTGLRSMEEQDEDEDEEPEEEPTSTSAGLGVDVPTQKIVVPESIRKALKLDDKEAAARIKNNLDKTKRLRSDLAGTSEPAKVRLLDYAIASVIDNSSDLGDEYKEKREELKSLKDRDPGAWNAMSDSAKTAERDRHSQLLRDIAASDASWRKAQHSAVADLYSLLEKPLRISAIAAAKIVGLPVRAYKADDDDDDGAKPDKEKKPDKKDDQGLAPSKSSAYVDSAIASALSYVLSPNFLSKYVRKRKDQEAKGKSFTFWTAISGIHAGKRVTGQSESPEGKSWLANDVVRVMVTSLKREYPSKISLHATYANPSKAIAARKEASSPAELYPEAQQIKLEKLKDRLVSTLDRLWDPEEADVRYAKDIRVEPYIIKYIKVMMGFEPYGAPPFGEWEGRPKDISDSVAVRVLAGEQKGFDTPANARAKPPSNLSTKDEREVEAAYALIALAEMDPELSRMATELGFQYAQMPATAIKKAKLRRGKEKGVEVEVEVPWRARAGAPREGRDIEGGAGQQAREAGILLPYFTPAVKTDLIKAITDDLLAKPNISAREARKIAEGRAKVRNLKGKNKNKYIDDAIDEMMGLVRSSPKLSPVEAQKIATDRIDSRHGASELDVLIRRFRASVAASEITKTKKHKYDEPEDEIVRNRNRREADSIRASAAAEARDLLKFEADRNSARIGAMGDRGSIDEKEAKFLRVVTGMEHNPGSYTEAQAVADKAALRQNFKYAKEVVEARARTAGNIFVAATMSADDPKYSLVNELQRIMGDLVKHKKHQDPEAVLKMVSGREEFKLLDDWLKDNASKFGSGKKQKPIPYSVAKNLRDDSLSIVRKLGGSDLIVELYKQHAKLAKWRRKDMPDTSGESPVGPDPGSGRRVVHRTKGLEV